MREFEVTLIEPYRTGVAQSFRDWETRAAERRDA